MTGPLSVAIIGAGPVGLAATAHLRDLAAEGGNGRHSVPARVEAPHCCGTAA